MPPASAAPLTADPPSPLPLPGSTPHRTSLPLRLLPIRPAFLLHPSPHLTPATDALDPARSARSFRPPHSPLARAALHRHPPPRRLTLPPRAVVPPRLANCWPWAVSSRPADGDRRQLVERHADGRPPVGRHAARPAADAQLGRARGAQLGQRGRVGLVGARGSGLKTELVLLTV